MTTCSAPHKMILVYCFRKKRSIFVLLCILIALYQVLLSGVKKQESFSAPALYHDTRTDHGCPIPKLEINSSEVRRFFHKIDPLVCPRANNFIFIENQKLYIRDKNTKCNYTDFRRRSDSYTSQTELGNLVDGSEIKGDFFKVNCIREIDKVKQNFENVYATVKRLDNAVKRSTLTKLPKSALKGMNVYMFGFDSLSQLSFCRNLPKFYTYLKKMDFVVLNKYNIIGDGTPQALIPILTGKTEVELPPTQRRFAHAKYVNVYPFIWNDFENASYVTLYGEDAANIGTFTLRMKGFDKQPTDHYMRTFYTVAEQVAHKHKYLCWGSDPHHVVHFRYVEHFFDAYPDLPKFAFQFHSDYSHGHNNLVQVADDDMIQHVENLRKKGYLNNTMLIAMSDHGSRFEELRSTHQGKLEERLPMMSIWMPPWFREKYPNAMRNLKRNADVLTSPFDIYATLASILDFKAPKTASLKNRGISLFDHIPTTRMCDHIGIEAHWCSCMQWKKTELNSEVVRKSVSALIKMINNATKHQRKLCEPLQLKTIQSALEYTSNNAFLRFRKSQDSDGLVPDFSSSTKNQIQIYQIQFITSPGDKHFEASVKYKVEVDKIITNLADISHINRYGRLGECVMNIDYYIMKWCACRNAI